MVRRSWGTYNGKNINYNWWLNNRLIIWIINPYLKLT